MHDSFAPIIHPEEYRETLREGLTVIHRRDAVATTTDAVLLAAFLPSTEGVACELGAGGGIVSLLAAERGCFPRADLVERSPILSNLCRRNIAENAMQDRLTAITADLRELPADGEYSLVFANPPYRRAGEGRPAASPLADISRFERAGGIADFCRAAARLLTSDGCFAVVFPYTRREELLCALRSTGLTPTEEVTVLPYPGGKPKLLLLLAARVARPCQATVLTLCRASDDRTPTNEAESIYKSGRFPQRRSYDGKE